MAESGPWGRWFAAELGSGGGPVDLAEPLRADVVGNDAPRAVSGVAEIQVFRLADRSEPGFARHLIAEVVVCCDQGVGDRFPAGAECLGILCAVRDSGLVFLDRDAVHADQEGDDGRAVWGGGCGEGGAGGDHGAVLEASRGGIRRGKILAEIKRSSNCSIF